MTHGTRASYRRGCRCTPCRAANATYWRTWWAAVTAGGVPLGARVPAAEAHRVLALLRRDWPSARTLAAALGKQYDDLARLARQRTITLRTELRIRHLYRTRALEQPDRRRVARRPIDKG
jgi:hypothetical protein